ALLLEPRDELGRDLAHALHVAAVARVEDAARHAVADLVAVGAHLRPLREHLFRDLELLGEDRRGTLLAGELERRLPARDRELAGDLLGELDGLDRAVAHAEQRDRGAQAEEAHPVAALAPDLLAL